MVVRCEVVELDSEEVREEEIGIDAREERQKDRKSVCVCEAES